MCLCRDVETRKATPMDVQTNPFCAAGMHLPNGSFATFGGNGATSPGELCFDFFSVVAMSSGLPEVAKLARSSTMVGTPPRMTRLIRTTMGGHRFVS